MDILILRMTWNFRILIHMQNTFIYKFFNLSIQFKFSIVNVPPEWPLRVAKARHCSTMVTLQPNDFPEPSPLREKKTENEWYCLFWLQKIIVIQKTSIFLESWQRIKTKCFLHCHKFDKTCCKYLMASMTSMKYKSI